MPPPLTVGKNGVQVTDFRRQGGFSDGASPRTAIPAKAGTPAAANAAKNSFERANEKKAQIAGVKITRSAGGVPIATVPNPFETVTGQREGSSGGSGGAPMVQGGADAPCTDCQQKIDSAKADSTGLLLVLVLLFLGGGLG